MKLEGALSTFPLRELIDMVVYSSVTGVLNIYGPSAVGQLYFRDSTLYHVEYGLLRGVEALSDLLELAEGDFSFVSAATSAQESLYGPAAIHVQAAERAAARWRRIRLYVPGLDHIPQLLTSREAALRRGGPAQAPVIAVVDGRSSLRQLAAGLGWSTVDLAEAVAQLALDGLVGLGKTLASPGGEGDEHSREGLFDRLLTKGSSTVESQPLEPALHPGSEELTLRLLRGSN